MERLRQDQLAQEGKARCLRILHTDEGHDRVQVIITLRVTTLEQMCDLGETAKCNANLGVAGASEVANLSVAQVQVHNSPRVD
jgi:hypothetical protein